MKITDELKVSGQQAAPLSLLGYKTNPNNGN